MTNWSELTAVDPLLVRLREERFTAGHDELLRMVERLFEPLEYMSQHGIAGLKVSLSPFSVSWAWERYCGATTQQEVDVLVMCWVPTIIVSRLKVQGQ